MNERQRLRDLAVSDSGFVFDPYTGNTFSINATGRTILESLRDALDRDQIIETLRDRFEVGHDDLHRDIDDFVGILRRENILPRDFVV